MAMKMHDGDLSALFNDATQAAAKQPKDDLNMGDRIVHIRVSDIEKHPDNPLDEREIDDLAAQIVANGFHIETIEVRKLDNGKYRLISGHRRTAAKRLLLDRGEVTDDTMPCIIRSFDPPAGSNLTADDMEIIALISANRGQRKGRNLEERLREAKLLEPIARKIYDAEYAKGNLKKVSFRRFFARAALDESESTLQRLKSLDKLTDQAKAAVMSGKISETAAAQLASLSPARQNAYVLLVNHEDSDNPEIEEEHETQEGVGSVKHVMQYVQQEKLKEKEAENEEPDTDVDTTDEPEEKDTPTAPEKPAAQPKQEKKPTPAKEPKEVVDDVESEASNWVSEQLEAYHRKMDKVCFQNLVKLCSKQMDKEKDAEVRSQWDLRRAAAQLAYDREIKREEEE